MRPAWPRSPTTRGSRRPRSAAGPGCGRRATRVTGASDEENLAKLLAEVPDDGDRRVAYVCALAYAEPGGETRVFTERCEGELAARAARRRRLRIRPGVRARRPRRRPHDGGAERGGEGRDQPSRPRRARVPRLVRRPGMTRGPAGVLNPTPPPKTRAAAISIASNATLIAAEARGGRDNRVDRGDHRGDPLRHRPDGVDGRLLLGPQGGRAAGRVAPVRPREGRERRGRNRGDADPGRRRDHHLRVRSPADRARRRREPRRRHRGDRILRRRQRRRLGLPVPPGASDGFAGARGGCGAPAHGRVHLGGRPRRARPGRDHGHRGARRDHGAHRGHRDRLRRRADPQPLEPRARRRGAAGGRARRRACGDRGVRLRRGRRVPQAARARAPGHAATSTCTSSSGRARRSSARTSSRTSSSARSAGGSAAPTC